LGCNRCDNIVGFITFWTDRSNTKSSADFRKSFNLPLLVRK
jgi:hypothetical protein